MPYVKNFKALRLAAGLRQTDFGRAGGPTAPTIQRMERGDNCQIGSIMNAINVLNRLYFQSTGEPLVYDRLIYWRPDEQDVLSLRDPPRSEEIRPVEGISSPYDYSWSKDFKVVLDGAAPNSLRLPFRTSKQDHSRRIEACRIGASELAADVQRARYNIRADYAIELQRYVARLPSDPREGNILLADGSARNLRNMFGAEASILPIPFASRLKTLLEQHIGLRPYYPEIDSFYRDVKTGVLKEPLQIDVVESVSAAISKFTPEVFDKSVSVGIADAAPVPPPVELELPDPEPSQPAPPPDPLGEVGVEKSHSFQIASVINKLWSVFLMGEKIEMQAHRWQAAYESLAPGASSVIHWLRDFLPR